MKSLPIVHRELLVAARTTAVHRNRLAAVVVVATVAAFMLITGRMFGRGWLHDGQLLFNLLSFLAFIFCVLEGIRKTADCISVERRDGTLGLLFLTNLRGHDVVLGKLAANSLNSLYGLVAVLPVLALPLVMGGVLPGEYWRMVLVLMNTLFFSLCAGIWISSFSQNEKSSMTGAFVLLALMVVIPAVTPLSVMSMLSPYNAYRLSGAADYLGYETEFWTSLALIQIFSWGFLALASATLPKSWQYDKDAEGENGTWPLIGRFLSIGSWGANRMALAERTAMLDQNPITWLASRDNSFNKSSRGFFRLIAFIAVCSVTASFAFKKDYWVISIYAFAVINYLFKLRFASLACRCTAEARRGNGFEMILVTQMKDSEITDGLQGANSMFVTRALHILMVEFFSFIFCCFGSACANNPAPSHYFDSMPYALIAGAAYLCVFFLDLAAIQYAGGWLGLVSKRESAAVSKTILYILIIPAFTPLVFCVGAIGILFIPLSCAAYYKKLLKTKLRSAVQNQYRHPGKQAQSLPAMNYQ